MAREKSQGGNKTSERSEKLPERLARIGNTKREMGLPGFVMAVTLLVVLMGVLAVLIADRVQGPTESVYTPIPDVEFKDPVLRACVTAFAALNGWELSGEVQSLRCNNPEPPKISRLDGINHLMNLVEVNLAHNSIRDTGPLESLHHLETLDLGYNAVSNPALGGLRATIRSLNLDHNRIESLEWVADVPLLDYLSVGHNRIRTVPRLAEPGKLRTLRLESNDISEVDGIRDVASLEILDLKGNRIADIGPLAGLKALRVLELGENQISVIEPLALLERLQELDLSDNPVTGIEALGDIRSLERLDLSGTAVKNFEVLERLGGLEEVDVTRTTISCGQFDKLADALGADAIRTSLRCN